MYAIKLIENKMQERSSAAEWVLPALRSQRGLSRNEDLGNSLASGINSGKRCRCAPPVGEVLVAETHAQADDHDCEGVTNVQSSGNKVVVTGPPSREVSAENDVEDDTNDNVCPEVVEGGRGNHGSSTKDNGPDNVTNGAARVAAGNEILNDRHGKSNEPEVVDPGERRAGTKHAAGSNNTPDDTGVEESASVGASQTLLLSLSTDSFNVTEQKVVAGNLNDRQPNDSKGLGGEHAARRDLHVVANLHVRDVVEAVIRDHVSVGLEQHHGNGSSGDHITDNHLGNDVETGLLVGNSLNHTDGDIERDTDENAENVSPPG